MKWFVDLSIVVSQSIYYILLIDVRKKVNLSCHFIAAVCLKKVCSMYYDTIVANHSQL